MTELPSRERVADLGCTARSPEEAEQIEAILNAYRINELMTAAEWRDTIDYEAMVNVLETRLSSSAYDDTEDDETVRLMFAAAIGDTKDE